jgi:hypothetical protein
MKPTPLQLRYLRDLAQQTGTTFTPPRTRDEASRQIQQLKRRDRDSRGDITRERRQVQRELANPSHDAVRHRADDTTGYGASASWAHGYNTR